MYIEDDNAWDDVESDAFRRDFTVNALYYDINGFGIVDYTGGVDDLEQKVIRSIGDPQVRLREPMRILRAIKFAARFGFHVESETDRAMRELPEELLSQSLSGDGKVCHFNPTPRCSVSAMCNMA